MFNNFRVFYRTYTHSTPMFTFKSSLLVSALSRNIFSQGVNANLNRFATVCFTSVNNFCRYISVSNLNRCNSMGVSSTKDDFIEAFACNDGDMKDGEMKEVTIGESKALLVKENGVYSAIGPKCTHYGAPLIKGVLKNGYVRCPWHGACFNVKSGDIEDFPGLDSVPKHEVFIKDGNKVMIKAKVALLSDHKHVKEMAQSYNENGPHTVIIGGGPTSVTCAETLRQKGFTGRITIISLESHLPYDRTKLSKVVDSDPKSLYLRSQEFFDSANIRVCLKKKAEKVNTKEQLVTLDDGSKIHFDKLLIATGGHPRTLPLPGWSLKNVFVLRTPDDANAIALQAKDKDVVVCGASFIGMELASALVSRAKSVSVCEFFSVPFERILGKEVGMFLQRLHESKGVKFFMNASMVELKGENGQVVKAILKSGAELKADLVVAGVGVIPTTEFLKDSGFSLTKQGFINVDRHMRALKEDGKEAHPNIFAGGDIAMYPQMLRDWQPSNVQHWQMAHYHGRVVGSNMVAQPDKLQPVNSVPFFWTQQYGKSLRYTGYGFGFEDIVITGDLAEGKFCAYYTIGDAVVSVATMMSDPVAADVASRMLAGEKILKSELK